MAKSYMQIQHDESDDGWDAGSKTQHWGCYLMLCSAVGLALCPPGGCMLFVIGAGMFLFGG